MIISIYHRWVSKKSDKIINCIELIWNFFFVCINIKIDIKTWKWFYRQSKDLEIAKGRNRNDRRMMVRQTATKGPWEHWWYAIMYKPILFLSLFHFVILYFTLTNTNLKPSNFHSNRNLYFDNIGSNIVTPFYSKNLYCNNTWQGDEYKLSLFYKMTENRSTECMRIIRFI